MKKDVSEEDLIGYLLGALDPDEERSVQEALQQTVELRAQLSELEEKLGRLPDRFVEIDPPEGLSGKTLNTISIVDSSIKANPDRVQPATQLTAKQLTAKQTTAKQSSGKDLQVGKGNWTAMDFLAGAVVCFIVAVVLLPSISNSRFQTNLLHCQDNLRNIGYNMANIADSFGGEVSVPRDGDRWQASLFVQKMLESQLASDGGEFICPNDPGKQKTADFFREAWASVNLVSPPGGELALRSPVEHEFKETKIGSKPEFRTEFNLLRQSEAACGSYGFPAPQLTSKGYQFVRAPGSALNVLCADAACFDNPGYQSRNHGSKGQNVLLGDLSVDYISETACLPSGDHIYTNNQGKIQPGVFPGDNLIFRGVIQMENLQPNMNQQFK